MKFSLLLTLASLLASPALAANDICPATLATTQSASVIPDGYTAEIDPRASAFTNITFFDGPPKELASLAPDNEGQDIEKAEWSFDPASPRSIWVTCGYDGTLVQLQRELPKGVKSCTVTYKKDATINGYPEISDVICTK